MVFFLICMYICGPHCAFYCYGSLSLPPLCESITRYFAGPQFAAPVTWYHTETQQQHVFDFDGLPRLRFPLFVASQTANDLDKKKNETRKGK